MGTNLANDDGTISDDSVAFYAARAAGGVALMTMGAVGVSYPRGRVQAGQVGISDDRFLPGLRRLTDAVHREGGRVSAQLHHGGTSSAIDVLSGYPLLCPAAPDQAAMAGGGIFTSVFPDELPTSVAGAHAAEPPQFKEMDEQDIANLIADFADAAERAVGAGFDAIEVHAGHSYIIAAFLSPAENRRTDGYGGSVTRRARLMREVIEAIRARIGARFPLLCKINAAEFYVEGGVEIADVCETARIAEAAGADAITVSATHNYGVTKAMFSSYLPEEPAKLLPYAAAVKAAVSIPVVTAGRIEPAVADASIAKGVCDFIAMGRKQLADSELTNHLASGGAKAVRPCIYDYRCLSQSMLQQPVRCAANPDVGFEARGGVSRRTGAARRILVVGGGLAGMEVASRLHEAGDSVVLFESGSQLGGTALVAQKVDAPIGQLVSWMVDRLATQQVEIHLNTQATAQTIRALAPDSVVLATGGGRRAPEQLTGCDLPHVYDRSSLAGLLDNAAPPDGPVVILGSDVVALQVARHLHRGGAASIAVVDEAGQFGRGLSPIRRAVVLAEMAEADIAMHRGARDIRIEPDAVVFSAESTGIVRLPAAIVVVTSTAEPSRALYDSLHSVGVGVHLAGDSAQPGYIYGAMHSAADVVESLMAESRN